MPISRSRTRGAKRPKRKHNTQPLYMHGDVVRLKPKVFEALREDPDFVAMVRIGRVLNVLDHARYLNDNPPEWPSRAFETRHRVRTLFDMAVHIAQGLEAVQSLRLSYHSEEYFSALNALFGEEFSAKLNIVRKITNTAFHLDNEVTATLSTLKELDLPYYDFYTETKGESVWSYFYLGDMVDLNYLIGEVMDNNADRLTLIEILTAVLDLNVAFINAARDFVKGLAVKLKLMTPDQFLAVKR